MKLIKQNSLVLWLELIVGVTEINIKSIIVIIIIYIPYLMMCVIFPMSTFFEVNKPRQTHCIFALIPANCSPTLTSYS